MAKESGLGYAITCKKSDGTTVVTISNDVTQFDFATPRAVQDITGVDKSAHERLLLLADFSATLTGVFNPASSHTVFNDVASTSVARTLALTTADSHVMSANCVLTDYPITRSNTGELTWKVPASLADGTVPVWA